jgi:hypothetical protein
LACPLSLLKKMSQQGVLLSGIFRDFIFDFFRARIPKAEKKVLKTLKCGGRTRRAYHFYHGINIFIIFCFIFIFPFDKKE